MSEAKLKKEDSPGLVGRPDVRDEGTDVDINYCFATGHHFSISDIVKNTVPDLGRPRVLIIWNGSCFPRLLSILGL